MALALAATGVGACGEKDEVEKQLLSNIESTSRLSGRFAYLDEDLSGSRLEVVGLIEDDFRYKARLMLDGVAIWDEVVSDDAVAELFIEPQKVLDLSFEQARRAADARGPEAEGAPAPPEGSAPVAPPPGAPPTGNPFAGDSAPSLETLVGIAPPNIQPQLKALAERRWVVDPFGAPTLAVAANDTRAQGSDPFFDALTILDYTRKAVDASQEVVKYDKESLEPTYKPEDDPFPKPDKGAGVSRYDLKEPPLPTNAATSQGAVRQIQPPAAVHFRKMAIYVKGKRIVEIREEIDVQRKLKDLARNYEIKFPANQGAEAQVKFAVDKINELGRSSTNPPLRLRQMTVQFRDFEDPSIAVTLPTEEVVTGSLFGLIPNRGRQPKRTAGGSSGGAIPTPAAAPAGEPSPPAGEPSPPASVP